MKESIFSKQLRDDIRHYFDGKIHLELIQDSYRSGKKPYDFYCLREGKFIAFEVKIEMGKSFPFLKVKPHQPSILKEVIANGGKGYFILYFQKKKKVFVFTAKTWKNLKKDAEDDYRESVPFDAFDEKIEEIGRKKIGGETRWDIEQLWEII